jgi:hypothetical protein
MKNPILKTITNKPFQNGDIIIDKELYFVRTSMPAIYSDSGISKKRIMQKII